MLSTALLFSTLSPLALAAPHNRTCHRHHHQHHNGTHGHLPIPSSLPIVIPTQSSLLGGVGVSSSDAVTFSSSLAVLPLSSDGVVAIGTSGGAAPVTSTSLATVTAMSTAAIQTSSSEVIVPVPTPSEPTTTTTSTSVMATPAPTGGSSGGKPTLPARSEVGLAWNGESGSNIGSFTGTPGSTLSWYYNWALTPGSISGLEFVPQVWGSGSVNAIKDSMSSWPAGTKAILSFNEREFYQIFITDRVDPECFRFNSQYW
jgi:hypothetical protein